METQPSRSQQLLNLLNNPRVKGFAIAIVVLATIAVLQVNNFREERPIGELFTDCQLRTEEVNRLQLAFGKAGLDDFEVRDRNFYVPVDKRSEFIKVAADENAIPSSMLPNETEDMAGGYLLTKQQLDQRKLDRKKRQVREMLLRLPFVQQVWFDMDRADSGNAFRRSNQSAVVSIRSSESILLTGRHVESVRQMICGAIAGLTPARIVVIDLENGLSHREIGDEVTRWQSTKQQYAFEQKRFYESRVRNELEEFAGLQVQVDVVLTEPEAPAAKKLENVTPPPVRIELPKPGANGVVSLEPEETGPVVSMPVDAQVRNDATCEHCIDDCNRQITVSVGVPEVTVNQLADGTDETSGNLEARFKKLAPRIKQKVLAVLPRTSSSEHANVSITLLRQSRRSEATVPFWTQVVGFFEQHWTSLAVVAIGLMLMTLVNRTDAIGEPRPTSQNDLEHDVLAINRTSPRDEMEPEVRLSQMIEQDPEAAAKIIETWIRDAA